MPNASAGDIIKKAASLGLKLTANHVYAVRAIDKRRGRPARLGRNGASGEIATNSKRQSKTAFIRGFTRDTPAAKVVEEAKRAGVKISKAYVYRVRALSGAALPASLPANGRGVRTGALGARRDPRSEQRLTSLALEIGLLRATVLLDRVRARLGQ
ncbi:MAG: hypothetical protein ABW321_15425 [Polyangiales bacterium]